MFLIVSDESCLVLFVLFSMSPREKQMKIIWNFRILANNQRNNFLKYKLTFAFTCLIYIRSEKEKERDFWLDTTQTTHKTNNILFTFKWKIITTRKTYGGSKQIKKAKDSLRMEKFCRVYECFYCYCCCCLLGRERESIEISSFDLTWLDFDLKLMMMMVKVYIWM